MSWLRASFTVGAGVAESLADALTESGAVAVSVQASNGNIVLEPAPGEQPLWRVNVVTGLFEAKTGLAGLQARLAQALAGLDAGEPAFSTLEDEDWSRRWRQHHAPREFGDGLWVLPHDAPAPRRARALVRLEPGLAFGTGAHPTTALCLSWLAALALREGRVLDYGCGSGVLSIAAAKLGARRVIAIDHDPQALRATERNAAINEVSACIDVMDDDAPSAPIEPADVVVANILANALHRLAHRLTALTRPGGRLALCGILEPQAQALIARYSRAFAMGSPQSRDGWVLLQGRRMS